MLNALFLLTSFHFLQVATDRELEGWKLRIFAVGMSVSYLGLVFGA